MSSEMEENKKVIYKVVLTGGPCGGKTTGQARLSSFFENLGWKVYRVPETAMLLMAGGVKWQDLSNEDIYTFQKDLMKTMIQIEETYVNLAMASKSNVLIICDRGFMDATAYLCPGQWDRMKEELGWNEVLMRDSRYNQVVHLVTAARGAELFYETDGHATRYEGLELARDLDKKAAEAWVGHPYFDVIDNTTDFERKVTRMIAAVCNRLGLDTGDRLQLDTKKRKFLVNKEPADESVWPPFQDFIVVHDYLVTPNSHTQARIRRRGQSVAWDESKNKFDMDSGHWTYTHTVRRPEINHQSPELRSQISGREYVLLLQQRDTTHYTIFKKRRCFLWKGHYFQMDMYQEPCHPRCNGMIILETYTTASNLDLPPFLQIQGEITRKPEYSMYNLSKKESTPKEIQMGLVNGSSSAEAMVNGSGSAEETNISIVNGST